MALSKSKQKFVGNWFLYIIGLTSAELEKLFLNTLIFFAHFKNVLAQHQPKVFNLSRDFLIILSQCVYNDLYGFNRFLPFCVFQVRLRKLSSDFTLSCVRLRRRITFIQRPHLAKDRPRYPATGLSTQASSGKLGIRLHGRFRLANPVKDIK